MKTKATVAVVAMLLVAGCGGGGSKDSSTPAASTETSTKTAAENKGPIKLGLVLSFTGTQAAFDLPAYNGQELAVDRINAAGGINGQKIELVKFDQQAKPALGQTGALQLIEQGVAANICAADFDIGAPCAVASQGKKVPAISTGAADAKFGVQGIGPYAYTIAETTNAQGAALAEFAFTKKSWKKAYVLEGTSFEYTKGFARYFIQAYKDLGGSIVGHDTMANDDTSIAAQVTKLKASGEKPDVILLASTLPGTSVALQQLRAAGVDLPVMGPDGYDGTYWLKSLPNLSNVWFVAYGHLDSADGGDAYKLAQAFKDKFGKAPVNSFFLAGYATIEVLAEAIKQAGSTNPEEVNKALESLTDFPTAVGPVTFTPEQHSRLHPEMSLKEFRNGKVVLIDRVSPEKVPDPFK
jgi:branched-chain amino acid transport system substrate-binding protein